MEDQAYIFVVIEFVDERSVGVVHKSWIESTDEGFYCYWPANSSNISSRVKKGEIPDKALWNKHKIRVHHYTHDYELARLYTKKLSQSDTSNVEYSKEQGKRRQRRRSDSSDSEYEYTRKQKRGKQMAKKQKSTSESDEVSDTGSRISYLNLPNPPAANFSRHDIGTELSCSSFNTRSTQPVTSSFSDRLVSPVPSETPAHVRQATSTPKSSTWSMSSARPCQSDLGDRLFTDAPSSSARQGGTSFEIMVIQKLNQVIENQNNMIEAMNQLKASGGRVPIDGCTLTEDILPRPLNTVDEMKTLEESLKDDQYKKKMVLFLTSQGGHDSGDCLRRIMKRIGTNHLWSQYSLRGQKQKRSFQQHPICKIAIKCCLKNFPKTKILQLEEILIDFLKQAPHKKGGPKYKEPKRPRTAVTLSDSE
ncbi:uncharacterized protein LOC144624344 [Crassostrea virginica]